MISAVWSKNRLVNWTVSNSKQKTYRATKYNMNINKINCQPSTLNEFLSTSRDPTLPVFTAFANFVSLSPSANSGLNINLIMALTLPLLWMKTQNHLECFHWVIILTSGVVVRSQRGLACVAVALFYWRFGGFFELTIYSTSTIVLSWTRNCMTEFRSCAHR